MTIAAILQNKGNQVFQLGPDISLQQAVALLVEKRIGCMPIVDGGKVVGIFSERDFVRAVGERGPGVMAEPVSNVMTSPAVTITADIAVITALSLMTQRRLRHLPVLENGAMIGFVSIGDLVKYRIDKIESEAAAMRDYIQSV